MVTLRASRLVLRLSYRLIQQPHWLQRSHDKEPGTKHVLRCLGFQYIAAPRRDFDKKHGSFVKASDLGFIMTSEISGPLISKVKIPSVENLILLHFEQQIEFESKCLSHVPLLCVVYSSSYHYMQCFIPFHRLCPCYLVRGIMMNGPTLKRVLPVFRGSISRDCVFDSIVCVAKSVPSQ